MMASGSGGTRGARRKEGIFAVKRLNGLIDVKRWGEMVHYICITAHLLYQSVEVVNHKNVQWRHIRQFSNSDL